MKINSKPYADFTAFDPGRRALRSKSDPDNPRWFLVDVKFGRKLKRVIALSELREYHEGPLEGLTLLRRGNRLSIMPVEKRHFDFILGLE